MKRIALIVLAASIAGNVALIAALALRPAKAGRHSQATTGTANSLGIAGSPATDPSKIAGTKDATAVQAGMLWQKLVTEDLKQLVANLRAAGFSDSEVRAIVGVMLDRRFQKRSMELSARRYKAPYWKQDIWQADPQWQVDATALYAERRQILRDLFGTTITNNEGRLNRQSRYGPLSDEKLDAVENIVSDYNDLISQINVASGGMDFPWNREQQKALEAEKHKDLAAILTAEELELFDLRDSSTARSMRSKLAAFKPSETEFREIFPLQRAFDDKYGTYGGINESPQRKADQELLNEQIKNTLGDARYAEYQRAQDSGYRTAYLVTQRLGLPAENASQVYTLQQDYKKQADVIRANTKDREQRTVALADLGAEATTKLETLLTKQGADAYRGSGGGWLRSLTTPPVRQVQPVTAR